MRWLFFTGLLLIFAGTGLLVVMPLLTHTKIIETATVGCVVIFFIPICFGVGTTAFLSWTLAVAAALLFVVTILQWLLWRRRQPRE
ncbi:MAG: hypothetical protein ACK4SY_06385 [Pyrobaculum sp.]